MNISVIFGAIAAVITVTLLLIGYVYLVENTIGKRKKLKRITPWFWIAPALILLLVFLIYPVINTIYLSFQNANSTEFVGFANYKYIFTDEKMLTPLKNNLLWLVFFTGVTVTLGLVIAVLSDRVKYEAAAKAAVFLPMAISFVAAGVIWKFMYEYAPAGTEQIGTVNAVLTTVFPKFEPQAWLWNRSQNNWALIIVGIWMWTGFCMVILSAGLKGIPESLLEAARIDGAGEFRIFFQIILPLMKSTITVVATTIIINVLKIFDIVYVMTNGALGTEVIANRMYKEMFNYRNYGRASGIAVLLLFAIIPVMVINIKRFGQKRG
ncbi:MAG: sugar ABC transporter permease [Spirochaetales bacterium]|nr:sugar ABC transporter permease [Spirochaetales bacterium]